MIDTPFLTLVLDRKTKKTFDLLYWLIGSNILRLVKTSFEYTFVITQFQENTPRALQGGWRFPRLSGV